MRVYGMVSNIDANLGRLFAKLDSLGIANETLVIFLTDNGPQQPRYNSGILRDAGRASVTTREGIRDARLHPLAGAVAGGPRVVEFPSRWRSTSRPTVLEASGVEKPPNVVFDGRSLLPLLKGNSVAWPDRTLFLQWHRGDVPERFRAFAARSSRYKLLRPETAASKPLEETFELYDMENDPLEFHDVAAERPEVVVRLRKEYEAWYDDVRGSRDFAPPASCSAPRRKTHRL